MLRTKCKRIMKSENRKPLIRWAGSKRKLLNHLCVFWNESYLRYVEPFAGSACLFFSIDPPAAILGDLNRELIDTYRAVRDNPKQVFKTLKGYPLGEKQYYKLRAVDPDKISLVKRAARFLFLNRFCFNGLYRTNSSGKFNVPYSPTKTGKIQSWEDFSEIAVALKKTKLISGDFEPIVKSCRKGDFLYVDPPYSILNKRITNQYGPTNFGVSDLERLAHCLDDAGNKGVIFVLSYAECDEVKDIFSQWASKTVPVKRNIAGFSKHRKTVNEIIVTNLEPGHEALQFINN